MWTPPPARAPFSYRDDPSVPPFRDDKPVILFDGHCALCTGWVRFLIRRDRSARFRFLPAQSALGQAIYAHYGLDTQDFETNILLADGRAWFKLEGSIRMATGLGPPWSMMAALRILPGRWQDALYDVIARNRLAVFGRLEVCHRPDPTQADRFLA